MSDTIFALSSGAPPAAIAIVRVSGERAFAAAEALTAFRALSNSQTDLGDVAAQMATVARSARDPRQRAQIFEAFDGMNNPALAPALVEGL